MELNIKDRVDIQTIEDFFQEMLIDKINDTGLYDLNKGEEVLTGTYENCFMCIDCYQEKEESCILETKVFDLFFYELATNEPVKLKVLSYLEDYEVAHREVFWFNPDGSEYPAQHPDYNDILENMDIFTDEYE